MIFNWNAIPNLLCSIAIFSVGLFVYLQRRKSQIGFSYLLLTTSAAVWQLGTFFVLSSGSEPAALLFCRLTYFGSLFIPFTTFHFSLAVLDEDQRHRGLIVTAYSIGILLFLPLSQTSWFISGVYSYPWGYWWKCSFGHMIFLGFLSALMTASFYKLWRGLHTRKSPLAKKRLWYVLLALMVAYLGAIDYLPNYGFKIYPFGYLFLFFYILLTSYAIARYRLLDVELIVKKTLVFAGLFAMAMAVVAVFTIFCQEYMGRFLKVSPIVTQALGIAFAFIFYEPTNKFLVRVTDRYLFQKKEDVRVILNRLAQSIITILDIEKVGATILETLKDSLRLESGVILIQDEDGKKYEIMDSFGIQKTHESFPKEGLFIRYFLESDRILSLEDQQQKESLPTMVKGPLESWGAIICMPLFIHRDLIGLLVLGKKKSDQEFSEEELDCFPAVAGQVAIALSNARLYHILMRSQADFAQQAKMAAIGTLSAGISHEIKNPLQVVRGIVEMLRFNKKSGLYKDYTKEQYEDLISDALVRVLDAVNRATGVIDRLSSFAKKPKELKTEVFGLEQAMDDALNMVAYEFEQNQITVAKNYASNLPKVLADRHAIEEVFFNLLINARHAIVEKGTISVQVEQRGGEIEASIHDTGSGIPKENLEKIFDPFFTTKDTSRNPDDAAIKGSGLGLFLVREIIKRYGGRIALESEVGKGTTFHVFLPASPMPS